MKKVLFLAAMAIFFASCGNNQETTDAANQARLDSMSQELAKQHIIDSMNSVSAQGASALEANVPVTQSRGSSSNGHSHSNSHSHAAYSNNSSAPVAADPVAAAPPAVANTPTGPTAAEIEAKRKEDNRKKAKSAAVGAVVGAGAAVGAIAGKNDHFKKQDAAIGAGVGAVVGAGAGLLLQKRKLKRADTTQH